MLYTLYVAYVKGSRLSKIKEYTRYPLFISVRHNATVQIQIPFAKLRKYAEDDDLTIPKREICIEKILLHLQQMLYLSCMKTGERNPDGCFE